MAGVLIMTRVTSVTIDTVPESGAMAGIPVSYILRTFEGQSELLGDINDHSWISHIDQSAETRKDV